MRSIAKTFTAEDAEKFLKSNTLKSFSVSLPLSTTTTQTSHIQKLGPGAKYAKFLKQKS
jgi:hypothetical protein